DYGGPGSSNRHTAADEEACADDAADGDHRDVAWPQGAAELVLVDAGVVHWPRGYRRTGSASRQRSRSCNNRQLRAKMRASRKPAATALHAGKAAQKTVRKTPAHEHCPFD